MTKYTLLSCWVVLSIMSCLGMQQKQSQSNNAVSKFQNFSTSSSTDGKEKQNNLYGRSPIKTTTFPVDKDKMRWLIFSCDKKRVALVINGANAYAERLVFYDLEKEEILATRDVVCKTAKLNWSPDGKKCVMYGDNGLYIVSLEGQDSADTYFNTLQCTWSKDSKILLMRDLKVNTAIDIDSGKILYELAKDYGMHDSWSMNGEYILLFGKERALLYDVKDGTLVRELQEIAGAKKVKWSSDDRCIGFIKYKTPNIFSTLTAESEKKDYISHDAIIKTVWSPNNKQLVFLTTKCIELWNTETGKRQAWTKHDFNAVEVNDCVIAWCVGNKIIYGRSDSTILFVWDFNPKNKMLYLEEDMLYSWYLTSKELMIVDKNFNLSVISVDYINSIKRKSINITRLINQ